MIEYLALGDSYTIGTGVAERDSFPAQLAARLEHATGDRVDVTNLGVNGYTTADLIRRELPVARSMRPVLVTCLVGVNDFVQGVPRDAYRDRLREIYDTLHDLPLAEGRGWRGGIAAISIPDFSFTPQARLFGSPASIEEGLRAFNAIAAAEAAARAFTFIDIFETSRSGAARPGWIAGDGLHPGRAQYTAWVDAIAGGLAFPI